VESLRLLLQCCAVPHAFAHQLDSARKSGRPQYSSDGCRSTSSSASS
jgi:hypothetical protein